MTCFGESGMARRVAALALATWVVAGCQPDGRGVRAGAQEPRTPAQGSEATPSRQIAPAERSVGIEFDLPPDFLARAADGTFVLSAMQAGYFRTAPAPVRTVEIPRAAIRVTGRTGQVSIPLFPLPAGANSVSVRLRSVSSGRPGAWSEAVGPLTMPAVERPPRIRAAARTGGIGLEELERLPALKEALDPLLDSDLSLTLALGSFRRPRDLAMAIVLSRAHSLPFSMLCRIVRGPPATSLAGALMRLKPSLDATRAMHAAQVEARRLLAQPRGGRR